MRKIRKTWHARHVLLSPGTTYSLADSVLALTVEDGRVVGNQLLLPGTVFSVVEYDGPDLAAIRCGSHMLIATATALARRSRPVQNRAASSR
jgi:hypothetical protein